MKRILFLTIIVAIILVSCAPKPTPVATSGWAQYQNGKPFHFFGTNNNVPVVRVMMAGFWQACQDFGLDCKLMTVAGNDIAGSVALVDQATALGSAGFVTTMYDSAWYAGAKKAIAANIPVINAHFAVDQATIPGLTGWIAPDMVGYGATSAKAMADKIGCKGTVAITQSTTNTGENEVSKAFTKAMKAACPSVKVLDPQMEGTDPAKSVGVASAIIQANPDLVGAFGTTGGSIVTWTTAASENGKKPGEIAIIGMDYTTDNLDRIKDGRAYAAVGQPTYEEMYEAVVLLLETRMGFPIAYENTLASPLIFKADVDQYYKINQRAEQLKIP